MARTKIDVSLIAPITTPLPLLGVTDASDAAAGKVGEVISSLVTAEVIGSTTLNTFTDTGNSVSLTAGDWDVSFGGQSYTVCNSGSGTTAVIYQLRLTDNSNVTQRQVEDGMYTTTTTPFYRAYKGYLRISISTTTVFKLRFGALANSGSPTVTAVLFEVSAANPGYISARRVR